MLNKDFSKYCLIEEKVLSVVERWGNFHFISFYFSAELVCMRQTSNKSCRRKTYHWIPKQRVTSCWELQLLLPGKIFMCFIVIFSSSEILVYIMEINPFRKLLLVFHESVLLLIMNFIYTLVDNVINKFIANNKRDRPVTNSGQFAFYNKKGTNYTSMCLTAFLKWKLGNKRARIYC